MVMLLLRQPGCVVAGTAGSMCASRCGHCTPAELGLAQPGSIEQGGKGKWLSVVVPGSMFCN
jgi:hypothetical protein